MPLIIALILCQIILSATPALAANPEIITAARACAEKQWFNKAGHERTLAYRDAVDCFKTLYIRVAAGARSNEALEQALSRRLQDLETAYHASRAICPLQAELGLEDQTCGTINLSPNEFVQLLKTMIVNADAGWVGPDPTLADALGLVPDKDR